MLRIFAILCAAICMAIQVQADAEGAPAIHGPRITGCTPGNPFMFLIPATGEGPLEYSASNLPEGLSVDKNTGVISGSLKEAGEYIVKLKVKGPEGKAKRKLKIVGGDHKLALTPPMGWNSYNVWCVTIDDQRIRQTIDCMASAGLTAHGYQYVNMDEGWSGGRDANDEILPNEGFKDMKALADYAHSKGIKLGLYSSPGPKGCGGTEGSYEHEDQDALTFASWGIDYLKYDLCTYTKIFEERIKAPGANHLEEGQRPYIIMRKALDKCERDIVYSMCQYGCMEVWKWGAEVAGANCWRTHTDITDEWYKAEPTGYSWPVANLGFFLDGLEQYAGPGHWNDPDMLVVGKVGWGTPRDNRLTHDEQFSHFTLWCMTASPLLLGCDLSQLDPFTLDLVTNDEVLDVDQDPLGKPAGSKVKNGDTEIWSRPLWDGTIAVALFNRGEAQTDITVKWPDVGISGKQPVRDLWKKKDLGKFDGAFTASVPLHGVVLVKIGKPNRTDW